MFKMLLLVAVIGMVMAPTAFAAGPIGSSSSLPDRQNRGADTPGAAGDAGHGLDHRMMRGREDSDFDSDAAVGRDPKWKKSTGGLIGASAIDGIKRRWGRAIARAVRVR